MAEVARFLDKAEQFLASAKRDLADGLHTPAASSAIHAGINAADALCGMRLGRRHAGSDHRGAGELLGTIRPDGAKLATDFARLVSKKTPAEYDPKPVVKRTAVDCISWPSASSTRREPPTEYGGMRTSSGMISLAETSALCGRLAVGVPTAPEWHRASG